MLRLKNANNNSVQLDFRLGAVSTRVVTFEDSHHMASAVVVACLAHVCWKLYNIRCQLALLPCVL